MRVSVAQEERDLEEQHAGDPNRGRSAEPGQDQLGNHRLHLKQQERAEENGDRIESQGAHAGLFGGQDRRGSGGCHLIYCKMPHYSEICGGGLWGGGGEGCGFEASG